ncbi:TRAP transporter small permease subunit [Oricola thermophila]|uniref:TRAP transporter small permease protein n=1 Tax=Oricola thermophila TaxID=2742145 RepID=A0A6N1VJZ8_9HYPH|nr:TRAP transporter small permease subunit [Oricola thermophila]QKV19247.1 TRAP transporter small permease subunit [Oricola thermophila]
MQSLLGLSAALDRILAVFGKIGAWAGFLLIIAVCVDVVTRYFGVPKPFGWNSTQLQESEYWLHTFLFALMIGYAYRHQAHVRIDLLRDNFPTRVKYLVEMVGIAIFLFTYSLLGAWYTFKYARSSFIEQEMSKSTIGLSDIWIVKSALVAMFVLMGIAAISQFIKALAGYRGVLPEGMVAETLGSEG